ncbi:MAG: type I restriction endonuclease subunit R [Arenicella sp.]
MTQSEAQLEENLIQRLCGELKKQQSNQEPDISNKISESPAEYLAKQTSGLGYTRVQITNDEELRANLKKQLEAHNKIELSQGEFNKILNHLDKGSVFERAKILRDRYRLNRDDGSSCYIQFFNSEHWCQNQYQVTSQVTMESKHRNRYDVTLLINGLPLVQIELKRRGVELKEAFNQINRYQRYSYWAESGLFNYVQIFVISNGVNTKYYANNRKQHFKQTFFWTDKKNKKLSYLDEFADTFLEKCHVSKMISKYIVMHESDRILMVLRPYQYYAVEAIVNRVKNGRNNGYIWHTTGSGKTLTSFKTAQILTHLPKVHKVLFVVDRADLDYQTSKEFNYFSPGCIDETASTQSLVNQISGENSLIVTTIQKLNNAITKSRHESAMSSIQDKRVVFIFDECHRSQFGDTHKNIVKYFNKAQMFGFTGTPIFKKNATLNELGKRSTEDLFGDALHKYLVTNAIADDNVLPFSIEYWGKLKRKDGSLIDEKVASINKKEFFENPERIDNIVDWVIAHHGRKTHHKKFSAMMCVSSKDTLVRYYDAFQRKKEAGEHDLRVATIFTYAANEEDADANGMISEPDFDLKNDANSTQSRDKLESYVADYNAMFKTRHSVKDSKAFYTYYRDIAKRMKDREKESFKDEDRCDILLVVNMYLTGFDAKKLNTLYVDKNLKYHGLIQAFSRTNRTLGDLKSQGNIVCFRNLKVNADEAITLFSDEDAETKIFIEPYEEFIEQFNQGVEELLAIALTPKDVDLLISEDDQVAFVKAFRNLIRLLNVLKSFTEFSWKDVDLSEQIFEDFKSKYLDIYERTRANDEGVSIVDDLDFELELIHRDDVNVAYILKLLADLKKASHNNEESKEYQSAKKQIIDLLSNESQLRSKRDLIEKFIEEHLPSLKNDADLEGEFENYWSTEKQQALEKLSQDEKIDPEGLMKMIDEYNFSGKAPLRDSIFDALTYKPKLMERKKIFERISSALIEIVEKFDG